MRLTLQLNPIWHFCKPTLKFKSCVQYTKSKMNSFPSTRKLTFHLTLTQYGGLKKKCILRLAKAKLKKEKKMTLPILHTPLCCSASKQHKTQLTTHKKRIEGDRVDLSFKRLPLL